VVAALPVAFDGVKLDTSGKELVKGLVGEGHVRQEQICSPRLKKNIGYAWVPVVHAGLGTTLTVGIPGAGDRPATVVKNPFVDPEKEIPKS
jgi:glycine cleavage system aminomethyltransferase T